MRVFLSKAGKHKEHGKCISLKSKKAFPGKRRALDAKGTKAMPYAALINCNADKSAKIRERLRKKRAS
jgi:hypothetical protein